MAKPNLSQFASASGIDTNDSERMAELIDVLYGGVGSNMDARDWDAIMKSPNPFQTAKSSLAAMYADPVYRQQNLQYQISRGEDPAQVSAGYINAAGRLGFSYQPTAEEQSIMNSYYKTPAQQAEIAKMIEKAAPVNNQTGDWQNKFKELEGQFNSVQQQLANRQFQIGSLQDQYDMLNKEYSKARRTSNSGIVGSFTVDDGSTFNFGDASSGTGTTGVVYGPDGSTYSSVAAAVAAGVPNYSFTKPITTATPDIGPTDATSAVPTAALPEPTAFNPSGLISGANQQLYNMAPGARMPGARNPFAMS